MIRNLVLCTGSLATLIGCRPEPQVVAQPAPAAPSALELRAELDGPQTGLERIPLTVRSGNNTHRFTVEVAATEGQQSTGMMFREEIGPNEGMLFPFPQPRPASFWMRNTLIPLDLVFIRADGTVARVAAEAVPLSLAPIESGEPVTAVLEIAGGRGAELGIDRGARVSWQGGPSF